MALADCVRRMTAPVPDNPSNTHLLITLTRVETRIDDFFRRIDKVEDRVAKLESNRWPIPAIGALTGVSGLVIAAVSLFR